MTSPASAERARNEAQSVIRTAKDVAGWSMNGAPAIHPLALASIVSAILQVLTPEQRAEVRRLVEAGR